MARGYSLMSFLASMLGLISIEVGRVLCAAAGITWAVVLLSIIKLAVYGIIIRMGGMDIGDPGIPWGLWPFALMAGTICYGIPSALRRISGGHVFAFVHPFIYTWLEFNFRGPFLLPRMIHTVLAFSENMDVGDAFRDVCFLLCMCCMKYKKDQRRTYVVFLVEKAAKHVVQHELIFVKLIAGGFACVGIYALANSFRQGYRLPRGLQSTKFVTLAHLRKMLRTGERIKRCQEMPAEAFGDVRKARQIIVTSHRWLDRFACDVPSEAHPKGVRLQCMVESLAGFYADGVCSALSNGGTRFSQAWSLFQAMRFGGSDILVFFDFMGVPQQGMDPEGRTIERTAEEQEIFNTILPSMGWCYTMFPTMVLPEVLPGVHSYEESGWCYSEFMSALLLQKLLPFSKTYFENALKSMTAERAALLKAVTSENLTADTLTKFLETFKTELSSRRFYFETDRNIVAGFIESCLLKRRLVDAVRRRAPTEVQQVIEQLRAAGLGDAINDGVDSSQNTVLHLSARHSSAEVVKLLLHHGADARVRNFWGDQPDQCWMLPRASLNAKVVREARRQPMTVPDLLQPGDVGHEVALDIDAARRVWI